MPLLLHAAIQNPINAGNFIELVKDITKLFTEVAIPIVVIFLIYAGFLFVTARGDQKQLGTAKDIFYWTILGAIIVVAAYVLATAAFDLLQSLGNPST